MWYAIWALGGWCGNEIWNLLYWLRHRQPPPPPPDPWGPWLVGHVLGAAGGIASALLFAGQVVSQQRAGLAASNPMPGIVGSLIGGIVISGVVGRLQGR